MEDIPRILVVDNLRIPVEGNLRTPVEDSRLVADTLRILGVGSLAVDGRRIPVVVQSSLAQGMLGGSYSVAEPEPGPAAGFGLLALGPSCSG